MFNYYNEYDTQNQIKAETIQLPETVVIKNKIKQAFNKAVYSYDHYCGLQIQTGKKLLSLVKTHYINSCRIIDLGCGTGVVTQEIAKQFNYMHFHAIDFADQLLNKAREQLSPYKIILYEADFNSLSEYPFDIMFSNLSLHWSPNFSLTLKNLSRLLSKEGILAFSIPLAGSLIELQPFSIKHFMDEAEVKHLVLQNGYTLHAAVTEEAIYEFDTFLKALKSIKNVGANYTEKQTKQLGTHRLIKQMIKSNQNVSLTYKIGYFIISHSQLR